MKYMGSKRAMLANGLGETLRAAASKATRFADLFTGSGAIAWHIAEKTDCPVLATDLQLFAASLAEAVIGREAPLDEQAVWTDWHREAQEKLRKSRCLHEAERFEKENWKRARRRSVDLARHICSGSTWPITRTYGGYYFSPKQALILDALRSSLPAQPNRDVALAALICAASECAAAPGHTAQPFQPTPRGASFLFEAWHRDVCTHARSALARICPSHARSRGEARVSNAEAVAERLMSTDVAFIDPPYSGVHYSRFYHVLETVARGVCGQADGAGRYPPPGERPSSDFSIKSKSKGALERLLAKLAERGVRTVLTFPQEETSNGLSGQTVEAVASNYFATSKYVVNGRFSTLGGNSEKRKARIPAYEVVLTLIPR